MRKEKGWLRERLDTSRNCFRERLDTSRNCFRERLDTSRNCFRERLDTSRNCFRERLDTSRNCFRERLDTSKICLREKTSAGTAAAVTFSKKAASYCGNNPTLFVTTVGVLLACFFHLENTQFSKKVYKEEHDFREEQREMWRK